MAMTICRECRKLVSSQAKTCPHCGIAKPARYGPRNKKSRAQVIARLGVLVALVFVLVVLASFAWSTFRPALTPGQKPAVAKVSAPGVLSLEGVKALSSDIRTVLLTPQADKEGTYLVELVINKDPYAGGGAQDWNAIADEVANLSRQLLQYSQVVRINFSFPSDANQGLDWAWVILVRAKLPQNWQDLSYLQFFAATRPVARTAEAEEWLCEFYAKYRNAAPGGKIPDSCKIRH
jgi:hypothetical protein